MSSHQRRIKRITIRAARLEAQILQGRTNTQIHVAYHVAYRAMYKCGRTPDRMLYKDTVVRWTGRG